MENKNIDYSKLSKEELQLEIVKQEDLCNTNLEKLKYLHWYNEKFKKVIIKKGDLIQLYGHDRYEFIELKDNKLYFIDRHNEIEDFEYDRIKDSIKFNWYHDLINKCNKFKYFQMDFCNLYVSNIEKENYRKVFDEKGQEYIDTQIKNITNLVPEKLFEYFKDVLELPHMKTNLLFYDFSRFCNGAEILKLINTNEWIKVEI